ncbi:hypothetical protein WG66_007953 [Moniliophthora roreri]|nr:hypothetical protein WG66_007953 [Moniliophthora roreri]
MANSQEVDPSTAQGQDDGENSTVHVDLSGPDHNGIADSDTPVTVNTSSRSEDLLAIATRDNLDRTGFFGNSGNSNEFANMLSGGDYDGDRAVIVFGDFEENTVLPTGAGDDGTGDDEAGDGSDDETLILGL